MLSIRHHDSYSSQFFRAASGSAVCFYGIFDDFGLRNFMENVTKLLPTLGNEPGLYSAVLIRDVLLQCLEPTTRSKARSTATSLRMYLRYLASDGRCRAKLIDAVPSVSDLEAVDITTIHFARRSGAHDRLL